jgi:DNA-binding CsgD family transcriptional regulator
MTPDAGRVDALIDGIYEAALAPGQWSSVLVDVGHTLGATKATVFWVNRTGTGLIRAEGWNMDPEALALYNSYYLDICPRNRITRQAGAGEVVDDLALRKMPNARDREYYEWADAYGYDSARILLAEHNSDMRVGFCLYGPIREEARETEHRLLHALGPHVRRAAHLTLRMTEVKEQAEFGEDLFEMSSAMLLVDESGRVRRMNARAEAALAQSDGLLLVQGHLQAAKASEDAGLRREIAAALRLGAAPLAEGFALVTRPSGQPAWAVSAVPLPRRLRQGLSRVPPRALVSLAETMPRVSPGRLRRGFGLSQAEAEIAAALAGGMQLNEIAERRGASVETVRSQLKSLFAKLEVSTQAQLVGRIAAVAGVVSSPHLR